VIVTGGLGPTHDDVTMEGVAAAVGVEMAESEAAAEWLAADGYAHADLTERTTWLPTGADLLPNPEGVAPGCVVDGVYVLAGVPAEMKAMWAEVADDFAGEPRTVEVVHAAEPESALIDRVGAVRSRFGVDVGSYPGETVRLKVSGRDADAVDAAAGWLRERVEPPADHD